MTVNGRRNAKSTKFWLAVKQGGQPTSRACHGDQHQLQCHNSHAPNVQWQYQRHVDEKVMDRGFCSFFFCHVSPERRLPAC